MQIPELRNASNQMCRSRIFAGDGGGRFQTCFQLLQIPSLSHWWTMEPLRPANTCTFSCTVIITNSTCSAQKRGNFHACGRRRFAADDVHWSEASLASSGQGAPCRAALLQFSLLSSCHPEMINHWITMLGVMHN